MRFRAQNFFVSMIFSARNSRLLLAPVLLGWMLSGSAEEPSPGEAQQVTPSATQPPFQVVTDLHQTMAWIIDPAADLIWDSAGTIITAQGSQELAPTTPEGWEEVVKAAAVLTESGNLLMLPGRAAGDDWIGYARDLVATGEVALLAARAQDSDALFDAGGEIFQVCKACHAQYWVKTEDQ